MASKVYQEGIRRILDGTIDLDTATLKLMLVKSTYTPNADHDHVDDITEITATNYAGGFGGAGRKTATVAISIDNTNNKVIVTISDQTWSTLGGATNDTISGVALVYPGASDAAGYPIAFFEHSGGNITTNGGDFTEDFAAAGDNGGNLQFAMP